MSRNLISIAILVISILAFVGSQYVSKEKCPTRPAMKDLKAKEYEGLWYEIYRYNNTNQLNHECVQDTFTIEGKGFHLNNTMRIRTDKTKLEQYKSVSATLKSLNEDGTGNYTITSETKSNKNISIFDTDYTNYAILWNCVAEKTGSKHFVWILSRNRELDSNAKTTIQKLITDNKLVSVELLETQQNKQICDGAASLTSFLSLTILIVLKQFL